MSTSRIVASREVGEDLFTYSINTPAIPGELYALIRSMGHKKK